LRAEPPRDSVEIVNQGRYRGLRRRRGGIAAVPKLNVAGSNPVSRSTVGRATFPLRQDGLLARDRTAYRPLQ